jgi:hypothetical protein
MRRNTPEPQRHLTMADLIPHQESEAIARCTRAIDRLTGGEAKGRVMRYLNDRFGWTLGIGLTDPPGSSQQPQLEGVGDE